MIELLQLIGVFTLMVAWTFLFRIFLEFGFITWRMGDKIGGSIFFLVDLLIIITALVLTCL